LFLGSTDHVSPDFVVAQGGFVLGVVQDGFVVVGPHESPADVEGFGQSLPVQVFEVDFEQVPAGVIHGVGQ
jgi:hypothetical protein